MNNIWTVSIVIPNWNGVELLEKNIPPLIEALHNKKNRISEVIIVDDGSTDGSVVYLRENFPLIKVIKHKVNRGFPASVNTGVRTAKSELVCLLNTDVAPNENFLELIFQNFKDEKVFAVSLHEKGLGPAIGSFKEGFIVHYPVPELDKVQNTFWVSGGSGVFRRDIWMSLGGFDENLYYPFYWEDVDICYKAQKRSYKLLWDPKAMVIHEHEATVKKSRFSNRVRKIIVERNHLLFIWKNLTSPILFRKHLYGLIKRIIVHPGYLIVTVAASLKIRAVLRLRKKELKESRVSDEAIFSSFK